jgi:hypothetical protein
MGSCPRGPVELGTKLFLTHQVTIHDPKTYTQPFTIGLPIMRQPGYQVFEYACHEGNDGMRNVLSGARADEAAK